MKPVEELKATAAQLLEGKQVGLVIGFGRYRGRARPVFARSAADVAKIDFEADGGQNLASYLTRNAIRKMFPVAVVAGDATRRSVDVLIREHQVKPENVVLIDSNAVDARAERDARLDAEIERLWQLSPDERMKFWEGHFDRCTRCYACRQSCPNCYCTTCKADKNRPAWVETSAHGRGNFSWHFMRAFHQAGRCVECGACETACAADIPLMLLNRMVARVVADSFPVTDAEKSLLSGWSKDDDNSFFL